MKNSFLRYLEKSTREVQFENLEGHIELFKYYFKPKNNHIENIKDLIEEIKKTYIGEFDNDIYKLRTEKIYMKNMHDSVYTYDSYSIFYSVIAIIISCVAAILSVNSILPSLGGNVSKDLVNFLIIISIVIPFLSIRFINGNRVSNQVSSTKKAFFNLCVNILDDIETDIKVESEKTLSNNEVAATVNQEEQPREIVRTIPNQANGNWNVQISTLSIIDTIECVYRAGKLLRKMFRKKSRK
jgi:hypothetical protein